MALDSGNSKVEGDSTGGGVAAGGEDVLTEDLRRRRLDLKAFSGGGRTSCFVASSADEEEGEDEDEVSVVSETTVFTGSVLRRVIFGDGGFCTTGSGEGAFGAATSTGPGAAIESDDE